MPQHPPIIVFSHLRWDYVYQRPQHLLSRLAARHRIYFVEEPMYTDSVKPYWERSEPVPNVRICRPYTTAGKWSFCEAEYPELNELLSELLEEQELQEYLVWLYTPMALPIARTLKPAAVIYDCMDELSAFRNAPVQLVKRESELLEWADLVFTGGPSLYRAKQGRHNNLHCFPSSVDAGHFRQALAVREAADQASLPHPRLGFYGVIDERMDLALLDAIALAHPDWHIVMVGPVAKIDKESLPDHPNIHYLGRRRYEELPSYLTGWDVCLLPFARNESTRFISPTKTLEYMAAERMIVSTPITDVAGPYGDIVYLGDTPEAFIAACERALSVLEGERARRLAGMRQVLSRTSWDATARSIENLIDQTLARRISSIDRPRLTIRKDGFSEHSAQAV